MVRFTNCGQHTTEIGYTDIYIYSDNIEYLSSHKWFHLIKSMPSISFKPISWQTNLAALEKVNMHNVELGILSNVLHTFHSESNLWWPYLPILVFPSHYFLTLHQLELNRQMVWNKSHWAILTWKYTVWHPHKWITTKDRISFSNAE